MVKVPLSGKASHAYLLLVGSTNHMQCRIANGIVRVYYTDGTSEVLELVNPDNWCPIEQDFYLDDFAFDASRVVPTANENRPRNLAFNYIVRAA